MRLRIVAEIARTNLVRLGRDRLGLFFILVLPFLIILLFGTAGGGPGTTQLGLVGAAEDEATAAVLAALRADERLDVRTVDDRADAEVAVRRRALDGALVIEGPGRLALLTDPTGDPRAAAVVGEVVAEVDAVRRPAEVVAGLTGRPVEALATSAADLDPPVTVSTRLADTAAPAWDAAQRGAATNLVLFVFIASLVGSAALIETRQLGLTRRMLAGPVTTGTVLLGEGLGRYLVAALQGVVIVLGAGLLFGVDWVDPLAVLAIVAVLSLVGTGAALLFGAVFSNAEQAAGVAVPLGIGLGMLGGTMWPLEITPPVMQAIGRATPHAWALDALDDVLAGNGLPLVPMAVLVGFAVLLLAVAVRGLSRRIAAGR
jgi:ABC-2 type transport system permease protein